VLDEQPSMEEKLKIDRCLLAVLFLAVLALGASLAEPSFAKEHRHPRAVSGSATARGSFRKAPKFGIHVPNAIGARTKGEGLNSPPSQEPINKSVNPAGLNVESTSPPAANKSPDANAGIKPRVPAVPPVHSTPVVGPAHAVPRNAIGQPVAAHEANRESTGPRVDVARPAADFAHPVGLAGPVSGSGQQLAAHQNPNLGSAVSGKIHPFVTPTSLGGPAKVVIGINGTMIRPKH
jgi:hypothetical protein